MTRRLLPWPNRTLLHLRAHGGPLSVVFVVGLGFLGLTSAVGVGSSGITQLVIALGTPLVLSSGGLGVRSGTAMLWVQKPVAPVRHYLATALQSVAISVGMVLILLVVLGAVGLRLGIELPPNPLRVLCTLALFSLMTASMACGASVWLAPIGWLVALAIWGFTLFIQVRLVQAPDLSSQLWVQWVLALLPPSESIIGGRALARVFLYAVIWVGVGALGLPRLFANGRLL